MQLRGIMHFLLEELDIIYIPRVIVSHDTMKTFIPAEAPPLCTGIDSGLAGFPVVDKGAVMHYFERMRTFYFSKI
jgi:hypothetical protein